MSLNLVMLGPPGAGKGTQAARLTRLWSIPHISTGAILRDAIKAGTPLGRQVQAIIERGSLIDDDTITRIVCERLQQPDVTAGFLLDGFPRTVPQAESLDGFLGSRPLVVIEIALTETEVLRRLASRLICSECGANALDDRDFANCHDCGGKLVPRADDAEQVVRERLSVYRRQTAPLIDFYGNRPGYCRVDGSRFVDDVTAEIVHLVNTCRGRTSRDSV
jgi:adenylate kinase